jgi:hypothetical protein
MKALFILLCLLLFSYSTCLAQPHITVANVDCSSIIQNFTVGDPYPDPDQYPPPQIIQLSDGSMKYLWSQETAYGQDSVSVLIDKDGNVTKVHIIVRNKKLGQTFAAEISGTYGIQNLQNRRISNNTVVYTGHFTKANTTYTVIVKENSAETEVLIQ